MFVFKFGCFCFNIAFNRTGHNNRDSAANAEPPNAAINPLCRGIQASKRRWWWTGGQLHHHHHHHHNCRHHRHRHHHHHHHHLEDHYQLRAMLELSGKVSQILIFRTQILVINAQSVIKFFPLPGDLENTWQ